MAFILDNPAPGTAAARAGTRAWVALAVLMLPVLLISVDNTVLSFAVPAISLALVPSASELLWIIDVYPLVLAALLVPMGSLADRYGRRRLLLLGSTGFAVVSVMAAFAPTATALARQRCRRQPAVPQRGLPAATAGRVFLRSLSKTRPPTVKL